MTLTKSAARGLVALLVALPMAAGSVLAEAPVGAVQAPRHQSTAMPGYCSVVMASDAYSTLTEGDTMHAWQSVIPEVCANQPSVPGYDLVMQGDGNLVLYDLPSGYSHPDQKTALWSTGTWGQPGAWAVLQDDGNFVVYSAGNQPLWASGTSGCPSNEAVGLQDPSASPPMVPWTGLGIVPFNFGWSAYLPNPCYRILYGWPGVG